MAWALNISKFVSGIEWGYDNTILLNPYVDNASAWLKMYGLCACGLKNWDIDEVHRVFPKFCSE
jgi:hypothetical protein